MKTVLRKILSVMLVLCIWTALMPFSIMAEGGNVCEIDGTTYATLDGALAAVSSGETIRLLENIDYDGGIVIEDKSVTFDLNGYTLNAVNTAEAGTEKDRSGLYVKGNATVALIGEGEFNVTGSWYGVYAECEADEVADVSVTNAEGNVYAGVMSYHSKVTVKENATGSGPGSYGVSANFENADVTVEGDVVSTGDTNIGVGANSSAIVTVYGNITVNGNDTLGIEVYDDGEVNAGRDVTVSGDDSVGIHAAGSCVDVAGNVTGDYGGVNASVSSGIDITGDVQSFDEFGYGLRATENCGIDVGGNVRSNGTGVLIWEAETADYSEITIDGIIEAPEYIRIGTQTLAVEDGYIDSDMIDGYRIYTYESLGGVLVAEFAGGDGSEEYPYLVAHADQLYNVSNHLDKHFKQIEDIDLSGYSTGEGWEPIADNSTPFTGTFDGDEHTISNLFISRSDYDGLFGYTGGGAEIRNLGLVDVDVTGYYPGGLVGKNCGLVADSYVTGNVTGRSDVGGLAGQNDGSIIDSYFIGTVTANWAGNTGGLVGDNNGTVTGCHTEATVTSVDDYVGGLVGGNFGPITDSYASGTVTGDDYVGGLAGWSFSGDGYNGEITASYSTCSVEGIWDVGGLVGENSGLLSDSFATGIVTGEIDIGGLAGSNYSSITNSYATGDVEGDAAVAGLVGYNTASIINCYAIGTVEGNDYVGGLVGDNGSSGSGTATSSYWDTEASGIGISVCGEGKTTAEMKQQETYDGWDFEEDEIWGINDSDNYGYPFLRWQGYEHGQADVPPVLSETGASSVTVASATLNFTSDKEGTYYFLVYPAAEAAPDAAAIKAQGEASAKGTGIAAAAANAAEVTGLTASTAYKAYIIVEDADENISNVGVISFTTSTAEVPIGAAISPALCTFDIESPDNVSTTITWGSATTVTDVVYGTTPLTAPADYNVSGNTLTITAGYLEGLNLSAGDTAEFEISFDAGDSVSLTVEAVQNYSLIITARTGGSITTGSSGNYAAGTVINIAAEPSSGYGFNIWSSVGGGTFGSTTSACTTFTMPANDAEITASFTYNGSGRDDDDDDDDEDRDRASDTLMPSYKADVSETGISKTTLPVSINTNAGNAAVGLETQAGDIFAGEGNIVITVPSIPDMNSYTLITPASSLSGSQGEGSLTFATGIGNITMPYDMLSEIPVTEGKKAGITIGQGDKSGLTDAVKAVVGNRPLVQLTLTLDGTQTEWNNPEAPVTLSIPYTSTKAELADSEHIVVWYIDGAGNAVSIPNGRYNPATGDVTFTTTHFSYYAVAYVQKTFGDLDSVAWAKESVEVIASKGILEGTSETEYFPKENITRADFLCFLVRTLGIDAEVDGNFDDISSDAYYYKEIGIAKKLGITGGTGNNKFSPDACITRQDMMVLTERALRILKKLEAQGTLSDIDRFADKSLVAAYAVNSVASIVKEGLIVGSGDKINPSGNTTRAETAVFLYRLYNKYNG